MIAIIAINDDETTEKIHYFEDSDSDALNNSYQYVSASAEP